MATAESAEDAAPSPVEDARDEWEKELNKKMRELLEHYHDDEKMGPSAVGSL